MTIYEVITSTETRTVDLTHIEPEFEKPCEMLVKGCDRTAQWIVWGSHSIYCDEITVYSCDKHKEFIQRRLIELLKQGGGCSRCGMRYTGQVSDHLRAIQLVKL
jgi:hypothetical protein